jgi:hypothetical protein
MNEFPHLVMLDGSDPEEIEEEESFDGDLLDDSYDTEFRPDIPGCS